MITRASRARSRWALPSRPLAHAFAYTELTGLDLSKASSLVEIGEHAFDAASLTGTIVIPATVTTIGPYAFAYTELMGLELSKATVLTSIGYGAFFGTDLTGTVVVPSKVPFYGVFPSGVSIVSGTRVS